jgi:hypothetical protein
MAYQVVGACLEENRQILGGFGGIVPPENQVMWNLSNALLNLSMAVEADLAQIHQQIQALQQRVERLAQRR